MWTGLAGTDNTEVVPPRLWSDRAGTPQPIALPSPTTPVRPCSDMQPPAVPGFFRLCPAGLTFGIAAFSLSLSHHVAQRHAAQNPRS